VTAIDKYITRPLRNLGGSLGLYYRRIAAARGARIVVYHGVCRKDPLRYNTLFVTERTFEQHLILYKRLFHTITLDEFYQEKFADDRFNICLSFDDGFANNNAYVLPLLEKYQVPAVFFVTAIRGEGYPFLWNDYLTITSVSGPAALQWEQDTFVKRHDNTYVSLSTKKTLADVLRDSEFDDKSKMMAMLAPFSSFALDNENRDYWLQLTEEEIRHMSASPWVTIGSHGQFHNDLGRIPIAGATAELRSSKVFLENIIQHPVTSVAYPYGSYTAATLEQSMLSGYKQLLGAGSPELDNLSHPLLRQRMGINPFISPAHQALAIIKGNYD